ncbi:TPA: hypothetical protein HI036_000563 [Escherichia coli]|nr:hypothetical protein [Escherichia coli]
MTEKKYIVALDQGTTSSRAVVMDHDANIISVSQREFEQIYPKPGWVEHDPMEIWATQSSTLVEVLAKADISSDQIAAIGITNQRETTIVWEKETGKPIYNAIVWQCRRTAEICEHLKRDGLEDYIRSNTGLVIDPYFSGTKVKWILDHVEGSRERARRGELLFGTVDTWLIWKMTQGRVHVTDYTNASRTMLFNIHTLDWDDKMLEVLDIPREMLPEVRRSSEVYGQTNIGGKGGTRIPISGIAGDQQADSGIRLHALRVDGGAVANNFLMQFQSDILGTRVERPEVREVTALGAAYLAGLAVGFWQNLDELQEKAVIEREFRPGIETTERNYRYAGWKKAVKRAMAWEEHDE